MQHCAALCFSLFWQLYILRQTKDSLEKCCLHLPLRNVFKGKKSRAAQQRLERGSVAVTVHVLALINRWHVPI